MQPMDVSNSGFIKDPIVGEQLADVFCTMLKEGHLAGPFPKSPLFFSRFNKMFPLVQPNKVRPIIDLSYPTGTSYNDQIPKHTLRKVKMASAPVIGELIRRAKGSAILSKYDHISAYKLVSARIPEIKYQGFRFLSYYFYELKQIFGSVAAVHLYDSLHLLLVTLARKRMKSYVNPYFIQRILDDLVGIFTSESVLNEFHQIYTTLAGKIGIKLQPLVGKKAYLNVDRGTALGFIFTCSNNTWTLPEDKRIRYINKITSILEHTWVTEKELQELNGILNFIVAMTPLLKFLRHHILHEIRLARKSPNNQVTLSSHSRNQILIWYRILNDSVELPIPLRTKYPPIGPISILADAAGRARLVSKSSIAIAAAATTFIKERPNTIIKVCQGFFPESLVSTLEDEKGVRFGDKSNFLELAALLLGIIHNRDIIKKRQIILMSDSLPAIWALQKGRSRTCLYSSTLALAIATLLHSYECYYFLEHVPRISSYPAIISDALTRNDKSGQIYSQIVKNKLKKGWPQTLEAWLNKPTLDDALGTKIFTELQNSN